MSDFTTEQQKLFDKAEVFCVDCANDVNLAWDDGLQGSVKFGTCGSCKQTRLLPTKGGWVPGGDGTVKMFKEPGNG